MLINTTGIISGNYNYSLVTSGSKNNIHAISLMQNCSVHKVRGNFHLDNTFLYSMNTNIIYSLVDFYMSQTDFEFCKLLHSIREIYCLESNPLPQIEYAFVLTKLTNTI